MGCGGSSDAAPVESVPHAFTEPQAETPAIKRHMKQRLRKLNLLDEATKIPFILVELTGELDGPGDIEITGKNEYEVYHELDEWLIEEWGCTKVDSGDLYNEDGKIPFCQAQYEWSGYKTTGEEGLNNMGLMTMRLIDVMCGKLSWTLACVTGGRVNKGTTQEQQIVFKAPHPMNLVVPHMMVELRSAGYIEICADLEEDSILQSLDKYFSSHFKGKRQKDVEGEYCDRYYKVRDGIFKGTPGSLDSNFGLLVNQVCDEIVHSHPGWSLVASNAGNTGDGQHSEQQLVFRKDENPLGDEKYIQVVLNNGGTVEVNGEERKEIHQNLERWLKQKWGCKKKGEIKDGPTLSKTYSWKGEDMLLANAQIITFFEQKGWEMQVCSQQEVVEGDAPCREQQLFFRPGKTAVGTVEPHIFIELYAGEGSEELSQDEGITQVLANQYIRALPIKNRKGEVPAIADEAMQEFGRFIQDTLGGQQREDEEGKFDLNIFLCRGRFENNLAQWVMRVCDFMVDRLGWSFLCCSLCNSGELGQCRLQQLVFRYDGDKREVPRSTGNNNQNAADWAETELPSYWNSPKILAGDTNRDVVRCSMEEMQALQAMMDMTFKRILTRDRAPDDDAPEDEEMPYRLELKQGFRSENIRLNHLYQEAREEFGTVEDNFTVKTGAPSVITERLHPGDAYLFHGTNPSSAMSILKTGFVLDHSGTNTGAMFGNGVYLAECCSKSDEYGRDDGGNTYPGLMALLLCKCFIGNPLIVDTAGEHVTAARSEGRHSICGDRESKVGTYKEFVIFDSRQCYPEYILIYSRQYDASKVPSQMNVVATGSTGRFWQMKLAKGKGQGWKNVPVDLNKLLTKAKEDGESKIKCEMDSVEWEFDLVETKMTNPDGLILPIRAPYKTSESPITPRKTSGVLSP